MYAQDWLHVSNEGSADTLFIRYDSTGIYMPLKFDHVYENGSTNECFDRLLDAKRDHDIIGILFFSRDRKKSHNPSYIKAKVWKDSLWVLNNGSYSPLYDRATGATGRGARQVKLVDASTVIVPHDDPTKTVVDYYSDDCMVYRYTCDTSQTKRGRKKTWQRYPWPPPGNYHEDK